MGGFTGHGHRWLLAGLLGLGLAACTAPPPPAPPEVTPAAAPTSGFSGARAFAHLEALVEIGPRVSGTPGAEAARAYLRAALAELGIEARELRAVDDAGVEFIDLVAVIPGESTDRVVLAAPYDSQPFTSFRFLGANDGASGAALLLELARVLVSQPLPYTTWIAFLDGETPRSPELREDSALIGSRLLVRTLVEEGSLSQVRLAIYFNRVADQDLTIARDLRSHRQYRNDLFAAARTAGHATAFPENAAFDSPVAGHRVFLEAGVRRVVAIIDDRFGEGEPPGMLRHTEQDDLENCSPESLAAVGEVSVAGLRTITARLRRIDGYAKRPLPTAPVPTATDEAADPEVTDEAPDPTVTDGPPTSKEPELAPSPLPDATPVTPAPTTPTDAGNAFESGVMPAETRPETTPRSAPGAEAAGSGG